LETLDGGALIETGLRDVEFEDENPFCVFGDFVLNREGNIAIAYFGRSPRVFVPSSIETIGTRCFSERCCISEVTFETPSRVRQFEEAAFAKCTGLREILLPASLEILGRRSLGSCTSLWGVRFEDGSRLRRIEECAFSADRGLHGVSIPPLVEFIDGSAFSNTSVRFDWVTVNSPSFARHGLFLIDRSGTALITYFSSPYQPIEGPTIPSRITTISPRCFFDRGKIWDIHFEDGSSILRIKEQTFAYCYYLRFVALPASVEILGKQSFYSCRSLISVYFEPHSRLRQIGEEAFASCNRLTVIRIPPSVEILSARCFSSCTSLSTVAFEAGSKLRCLGSAVFAFCDALVFIELPSGVQVLAPDWHLDSSIGKVKFEGADHVQEMIRSASIVITGSVPAEED
jgi:hypothetical protein